MGTQYARVCYVFLFAAIIGTIGLMAYPEIFPLRAGQAAGPLQQDDSDYLSLLGMWIWVASPYIICAAVVKRRSWQIHASRVNLFGTLLICSVGVGVVLYAALYTSVKSTMVFIYTPVAQWLVVVLLAMF